MKKYATTLLAIIVSAMAFSQTPTTVKKENLKGNVFYVKHLIYQYSENFGDPTEGKLLLKDNMYFDELGRAILFRSYYKSSLSSLDNLDYHVVRYSQDGNNTIAHLLDFYTHLDSDDNVVLDGLKDYSFPIIREITYNSDYIVTKYDVFERYRSTYNLIYRKTAQPTGNGTYECKLYGSDGNTMLDFKETYDSNRHLTMMDNKKQFNSIYTTPPIEICDAGTYQYDNKGRLKSYEQQQNSLPRKYEYVYNEHGDIIEVYSSIVKKGETPKLGLVKSYVDYKYDDKGNWIYRIISNGEKKIRIEKREIDYYNSIEELEPRKNELYSKFPDF